jgi:hypothetical protein
MLLTEIVRFRLSKAERKTIEKMARERKISISDLMRAKVFGQTGENDGQPQEQDA